MNKTYSTTADGLNNRWECNANDRRKKCEKIWSSAYRSDPCSHRIQQSHCIWPVLGQTDYAIIWIGKDKRRKSKTLNLSSLLKHLHHMFHYTKGLQYFRPSTLDLIYQVLVGYFPKIVAKQIIRFDLTLTICAVVSLQHPVLLSVVPSDSAIHIKIAWVKWLHVLL